MVKKTSKKARKKEGRTFSSYLKQFQCLIIMIIIISAGLFIVLILSIEHLEGYEVTRGFYDGIKLVDGELKNNIWDLNDAQKRGLMTAEKWVSQPDLTENPDDIIGFRDGLFIYENIESGYQYKIIIVYVNPFTGCIGTYPCPYPWNVTLIIESNFFHNGSIAIPLNNTLPNVRWLTFTYISNVTVIQPEMYFHIFMLVAPPYEYLTHSTTIDQLLVLNV